MTALACADALAYAVALACGGARAWTRAAPYLRVALLLLREPARASAAAVVGLAPKFADVALLLVGATVFFGWFAALMFDDLNHANNEGVDANDGLSTFAMCLYNLWVASSTSGWPDQSIPTVTYARPYALFWFAFTCVTQFLFLNLLLAVVYGEYSERLKAHALGFYTNRARSLAAAFAALAADGERDLSNAAFDALVRELNRAAVVPYVEPEAVAYFYRTLDDDGSGGISAAEFVDLCDVLQYSYETVDMLSPVARHAPALAATRAWARVEALARALRRAMTPLLCVNAACVLVESLQDLENWERPLTPRAWGFVELGFACAYLAELVLTALARPRAEWLDAAATFDAGVTLALFAVGCYWASPLTTISPDLVHYFNIVRLTRLLSLLARTRRFRFLCECIASMALGAVPIVVLLFGVTYAFSALGVALFGGEIHEGKAELEGTAYEDADYFVLNFNDIAVGFLPFSAMLVSGGPIAEVIEGFAAVTSDALSGLFFAAYYYAGNLVLFNVFAAFIIDAFINQQEKHAKEGGDDAKGDDADAAQDIAASDAQARGYRVVMRKHVGTDAIYRDMFAEELEGIRENA